MTLATLNTNLPWWKDKMLLHFLIFREIVSPFLPSYQEGGKQLSISNRDCKITEASVVSFIDGGQDEDLFGKRKEIRPKVQRL